MAVALGLSSGLAYLSANSASTEEVLALAQPLAAAGAIYTTHMRSETEAISGCDERGLYDWPGGPCAGHRFASEVRRDCELAAAVGRCSKHSRQFARRSRLDATAIPMRRVRARLICARSTNGLRSRLRGAHRIRRSRATRWLELRREWNVPQMEAARRLQTRRCDLSQHLRSGYAEDPESSGDDDRIRWVAE